LFDKLKYKADKRKVQEKLFEECYCANIPKVRYYAYHYLNDFEEAESVAQEVFTSLWESREKLNFEEDIYPYIIILTRNKSINILRKRKLYNKYVNHSNSYSKQDLNYAALLDNSSAILYSSEIQSLIKKGIDKMPERIRDTFLLSRFSDLTNEEISVKQSVSIKTVESRVTSALKILREVLEDYLIFIIGFFIC